MDSCARCAAVSWAWVVLLSFWANIQRSFIAEHHQWITWLPVFFGAGIGGYFALPSEPSLLWGLSAVCMMGMLTLICYRKSFTYLFVITIALLFIALGFTAATWRTMLVNAPIITAQERAFKLEANIAEISPLSKGNRLILENITAQHLPNPPQRVRIIVRTKTPETIAVGDRITVLAVLSPPPAPVYPDAYDFARLAYFDHIGAVGYAVGPVTIIHAKKHSALADHLATLRKNLVRRSIAAIGEDNGSTAAAFMVGEYKAMDKDMLNDVRIAGLAHLLAVSGMHITWAAVLLFFLSRLLLSCSSWVTLHLNIKKYAAAIALVSSFLYLMLTGNPVSGQRAFIMTSFVLIAVMLDRTTHPMRLIAWAALLVMAIEPESILNPGFQMSFAAVMALIGTYEWGKRWLHVTDEMPFHRKGLIYLGGIVFSSLIAGLATTPFAIYHFNMYSSYGIIANLISIPISSFWVMPWGVVTLVLYPFGLEKWGLVPMAWGIEVILYTAKTIAALPYSSLVIPKIPTSGLVLITLGGCWLLLWRYAWRYWGYAGIIAGMITIAFVQAPDIIIDGEAKAFALKNQKTGELMVSSRRTAQYATDNWIRQWGQVDKPLIPNARCDVWGCSYGKVSIVFDPLILQEECDSARTLINLTRIMTPCHKPHYILNRPTIRHLGTHALWLDAKGNVVEVKTVAEARGERPWVR